MYNIALLFGYGQDKNGELMPQLRSRCDMAADAYLRYAVGIICITCCIETNGKHMCIKMREYLIDQGVPYQDIVIVPKGTNTAGEIDTFLAMIKLMSKNEVNVVAISSRYHLPRIAYLFWIRGIQPQLLGTWDNTTWRDIWIEPVKFLNSFLRPFKSAKFVK